MATFEVGQPIYHFTGNRLYVRKIVRVCPKTIFIETGRYSDTRRVAINRIGGYSIFHGGLFTTKKEQAVTFMNEWLVKQQAFHDKMMAEAKADLEKLA